MSAFLRPESGIPRPLFDRNRGRTKLLLLFVCMVITASAAMVYAETGLYGFNVLMRRGMSTWTEVTPDDTRLSRPMQLALSQEVPRVTSGTVQWRQLQPGFEVGELPVMAADLEVDRLLLARVDPARYAFKVATAPAGNLEVDDWLSKLGALYAMTGSFYDRKGLPDTPLITDGKALGPTDYDATHGAFVVANGTAQVQDLASKSWQEAFTGASQAMVSYPLLLDADGLIRAHPNPTWLANRSFVAEDRDGRIILGTTREAFFSLHRLGEFLKRSDLDVRVALNLDGGPVACQAVAVGKYRRSFCGSWETQERTRETQLLQPLFGDARWAMPVVLAVVPKPELSARRVLTVPGLGTEI